MDQHDYHGSAKGVRTGAGSVWYRITRAAKLSKISLPIIMQAKDTLPVVRLFKLAYIAIAYLVTDLSLLM